MPTSSTSSDVPALRTHVFSISNELIFFWSTTWIRLLRTDTLLLDAYAPQQETPNAFAR